MTALTKRDIFDTLNEFYEKIIGPRLDRIDNSLDGHDQKFLDLLKHFDQIYHRFERLETEYYAIVAGIDRMEKRLDQVERSLKEMDQKLDREIPLREHLEKEIRDLKQRVSILQERIDDLEKRLKTFS